MAVVTLTIVNGEATVVADGTPSSCKAAEEVEKAMGKTTKSVPTGTKPETGRITQR